MCNHSKYHTEHVAGTDRRAVICDKCGEIIRYERDYDYEEQALESGGQGH